MSELDVTLDWPGVFADWFGGERIAAGQPVNDDESLLRYAYRRGQRIRRGKHGYTLRLTLPAEYAEDILDIVLAEAQRWQEHVRATTGIFVPRRTRIALRQYVQRTRDQLADPLRDQK